jgi:phage-related protein
MKREFVFWKNYFDDFFNSLDDDSQRKVLWMLKSLVSLPKWEGNAYRIFCFFEKGNKIILCNGFVKKDRKTPKQEILKVIKIKEEYQYENEK